MTAQEKQQYFEQLCAMDEKEFQMLWEKSDVRAKLQEFEKRMVATKSAQVCCPACGTTFKVDPSTLGR